TIRPPVLGMCWVFLKWILNNSRQAAFNGPRTSSKNHSGRTNSSGLDFMPMQRPDNLRGSCSIVLVNLLDRLHLSQPAILDRQIQHAIWACRPRLCCERAQRQTPKDGNQGSLTD